MELVSPEPIARAEALDLPLHRVLLSLQAPGLGVDPREGAEVPPHESAHRRAVLGRADTRRAVDVVRDRDGDILHSFTVSHFHSTAVL